MPAFLHIQKTRAHFPKPFYHTQSREAFAKHDRAPQMHAAADKDTLFIPSTLFTDQLNQAALILIIQESLFDPESLKNDWQTPKLQVYPDLRSVKSFEIFKLKAEALTLELFLNYQENQAFIGQPSRSDHKIANLKAGQSLNYRINGKSDFTMSSGKQRTYNEYDYLISYWGSFAKLEKLVSPNDLKGLGQGSPKVVDERKILY